MHERRHIPRAHYPVFVGDQLVGEVTSGTFSPGLGTGIALAYLWPGDVVELGHEVEVDIRGRRGAATVVQAAVRGEEPALIAWLGGGARDRHEVTDPVFSEAGPADQLLQEAPGPTLGGDHRHDHVEAAAGDPHLADGAESGGGDEVRISRGMHASPADPGPLRHEVSRRDVGARRTSAGDRGRRRWDRSRQSAEVVRRERSGPFAAR